MQLSEAIDLIQQGIPDRSGNWADIGAGTGMFTLALMEILEQGAIYAVDKSPHALWSLSAPARIDLHVVEGDFNMPLEMSDLDGIIMANSLHYSDQPANVLELLKKNLGRNGKLIVVEYDISVPRPPWIPHPVPFEKLQDLAQQCSMPAPRKIATTKSVYGDSEIYSALIAPVNS